MAHANVPVTSCVLCSALTSTPDLACAGRSHHHRNMTTPADVHDVLADLPRLGWVQEPTPVTALPGMAKDLGLPWLGVKRDDLCGPLHGSSKTRKLDYLLAAPPWRDAKGWVAMGAIGSGQLVACASAAELLGRQLWAHMFWEPLSVGVADNLAHTAAEAAELRYHRSRISLALTAPGVLIGRGSTERAVIPPGATCLTGNLGLVRAGMELGDQVKAGQLPEPAVIYVALGSGGTTAGLAVGLGLTGLRTRIRAIATVEHVFASRRRIDSLVRDLVEMLGHRHPAARVLQPAPIEIVRTQLGGGYGQATPASLSAVDRLRPHGIDLEAVYTGKAMSALLAESQAINAGPVLFWQTARRELPAPPPGWRERLPTALARRLERAQGGVDGRRRMLLMGGAGAAVACLAGWRLIGPSPLRRWRGTALSGRDAATLLAFAEALLPALPRGTHLRRVVDGAERYIAGLPEALRGDVGLALSAAEQASALRLHWGTCSSLDPVDRLKVLQDLHQRGGLAREAARCVRDLCLLGYYALAAAWPAIGYQEGGPTVSAEPRPVRPEYAALLAPPGALPPGAVSPGAPPAEAA